MKIKYTLRWFQNAIRRLALATIAFSVTTLCAMAVLSQDTTTTVQPLPATAPAIHAAEQDLITRLVAVERDVYHLSEVIKNTSSDMKQAVKDARNDSTILISVVLSVLSLFYGITTFMQYRRELEEGRQAESREKIIQEQNVRHEEVMQKLLDTANTNIEKTTGLLETLNTMLKFSKDANEIEQRLLNFQAENEKAQKQRQESETMALCALNLEAIELCRFRINRDNYKTPTNVQRIRDFARRMANLDAKRLNGNAHLLLALHFIVDNLFDQAQEELSQVLEIAKRHMDADAPEDLYPDMDPATCRAWNKKLANICLYHWAIMHYNLGHYYEAEQAFTEAIHYSPNDMKAAIYIPEARYLERRPFDDVIAAFQKTKTKVESIEDTSDWSESRDSLLSLLLVRFGNCYFPGSNYLPYKERESLRTAEEHYAEASNKMPESLLAMFSYAQALALKSQRRIHLDLQTEARQKAHRLFHDAFRVLSAKLGQTTEPKIRVMYLYMIAICVSEAPRPGYTAVSYIADLYEECGRLPAVDGFRIFSPWTKNDLTVSEFKDEVGRFETSITNREAAKASA